MNELIERLRCFDRVTCNEAADLLEQQAAEIAALQAKLSAMEKQEPVAWVTVEKGVCLSTRSTNFKHIPDGQYQLYVGPLQIEVLEAPKVAQPSKPTFAEWCATNWDGPPSANARDAYNRIIGGQQP